MRRSFVRSLTALLLSFCCLFFCGLPCAAAENAGLYAVPSAALTAHSIYMVNLDTDTVVFEKNAAEKVSPASTTKIMTMLLTLESGLDLDKTVVTAPADLWSSFDDFDISNADIRPGEQLTLRQLLYCMALPSANEAAVMTARFLGGGDEAAFVQKMNERAAELGAENTHFENPHGLYGEQHYTTAADLFLIARAAMETEGFAEIVSTRSYTLPETAYHSQRTIENTNAMLDPESDYYTEAIAGIKTGTLPEGGRCFVSYAAADETHYITVVLGAPLYDANGNYRSDNCAFADTKTLCDWAFSNLSVQTFSPTLQKAALLPVLYGAGTKTAACGVDQSVSLLLPKTVTPEQLTQELVYETETLTAPVKAGTEVGTLRLSYQGTLLAEVRLVTDEAVDKDLFAAGWAMFVDFAGTWQGILLLSGGVLLFLVLFLLLLRAHNRRRNRKARKSRRPIRYN